MKKRNGHSIRFSEFMWQSGQLILLSIVWSIVSLPIVTLGPATAALYYAVTKSVRCQRGSCLREFFSAFRSNLMPGIPLTVLLLLYTVLSAGSLYFAYASPALPAPLRWLFFAVGGAFLLLILLVVSCGFILLSRLQVSLLPCLKTSLYFAVINYKCTIKLILLLAGAGLLLFLMPALLVAVPSTACLVSSFIFEPVFKTYLSYFSQNISEDSWYLEL